MFDDFCCYVILFSLYFIIFGVGFVHIDCFFLWGNWWRSLVVFSSDMGSPVDCSNVVFLHPTMGGVFLLTLLTIFMRRRHVRFILERTLNDALTLPVFALMTWWHHDALQETTWSSLRILGCVSGEMGDAGGKRPCSQSRRIPLNISVASYEGCCAISGMTLLHTGTLTFWRLHSHMFEPPHFPSDTFLSPLHSQVSCPGGKIMLWMHH